MLWISHWNHTIMCTWCKVDDSCFDSAVVRGETTGSILMVVWLHWDITLLVTQSDSMTSLLYFIQVSAAKLLLQIPFTSVFDYIYLLRSISQELCSLGSRAVIYCAAAVADYYIHHSEMVHYNIKSIIITRVSNLQYPCRNTVYKVTWHAREKTP